jgi:HPt (histidine-containing phosphotransfer) domain-containing protein
MTNSARARSFESTQLQPPIDVAEFYGAMHEAGLAEIITELIETFLEDAPSRFEAVVAAVEGADAEKIRAAAHAYKSPATYMRAHELAGLLHEIEVAGEHGDATRASDLLPYLRQNHEATVGQLHAMLEG